MAKQTPCYLRPDELVLYRNEEVYKVLVGPEETWIFSIEVEKKGWWIFRKEHGCYCKNLNLKGSIFVNGREVKPGGRIKLSRGDKIELGAKKIPPAQTGKWFIVS